MEYLGLLIIAIAIAYWLFDWWFSIIILALCISIMINQKSKRKIFIPLLFGICFVVLALIVFAIKWWIYYDAGRISHVIYY